MPHTLRAFPANVIPDDVPSPFQVNTPNTFVFRDMHVRPTESPVVMFMLANYDTDHPKDTLISMARLLNECVMVDQGDLGLTQRLARSTSTAQNL